MASYYSKPFILVCLLLISTSSFSKSHPCLTQQHNALLQFKNSISVSTFLDPYYCTTRSGAIESWKNDTDCCIWDGVTCDDKTGDVISLDIACFGLEGTIQSNSSLFLLKNLESLNLSHNDLSGPLNFLGQFPSLIHLDLSSNNFNGTIPLDISPFPLQSLKSLNLGANYLSGPLNFLGQFPSLMHLDLSYNLFNGTIALDISPFSFQNLESLNLAGNDLSGPLNFLGQFSSLMHLDLSSNNFNGTIPREIAHLSQLISLDLSVNNLIFTSSFLESLIQNLTDMQELTLADVRMGGISPSIFLNLSPTLTSLTLKNCSLRGRFPDNVFHLPNLRTLDLSENFLLTGTLPKLNWSSPLISLDLSFTGFSGNNIPNSIGNLKNLEYLHLGSCQFTDLISSSICSLSSLRELDLSGNKFSGSIPRCLGNLTNLQRLDLSFNELTGQLPRSLNNCTLLYFVNVSSNKLSDTFPYALGRLPKLGYVDLGHNRFYGPIGNLFNGSNSYSLVLRQNNFSGHLPDFDGDFLLLDLSNNNLEGPITMIPSASSLLLSNNNFTGKIPLSICKFHPILLDLSNNSLSGTIPPCLLNLSDIYVINLGMNKLEGAIPDNFIENNVMLALDLRENQLKGPLPRSMVNCNFLALLDLSNNNIEDSFPNWLEALPQLQVLALHSNKFNGMVNTLTTDHPFPMLRVFDISSNNLTGLMPIQYFGRLNAIKNVDIFQKELMYLDFIMVDGIYGFQAQLTVKGYRLEFPKISIAWTLIDFSNNNFQGEIPQDIGELIALKGLNFSHNNLSGSIPPSIQNLTSLEWLDLSSNKLNGRIPSGLTHLMELSSLNLSYNELSGKIPTSQQFDTFGMESFDGNMGLCGSQVNKTCGLDIPKQSLPPIEEDDFNAFDWKIILMGYGCGLVIGIYIGYMVFELRRPEWFVSLVEVIKMDNLKIFKNIKLLAL